MNAPLPHPVRVLVKGSSLVVMTPERDAEPGEPSFPRWIQRRLHDLGRPCEVENRGVVGERTKDAFVRWETEVMAASPDAVVYGYGYYECIHGFLPHWLEREVHRFSWHRRPVRQAYRRLLLKPAWKVLAQLQRVLDGRIRDRFFGRTVKHVIADYELLIERTRVWAPGSPLVLVLALFGPGGKAPGWFPGMQSRIDRMNEALAAMVARIDDPRVRLVPVAEIAARLDPPEDPVPDGLHYSPRMRRLLGEWIGNEIDRAVPLSPGVGETPESESAHP
jgi:hypothetical protein